MTETPKPAITLRPYQAEAVAAVFAAFKHGRSTLMVLPTATGKTKTASEVVRKGVAAGRSILWLAHREELIEQAAGDLKEATGIDPLIEMAEREDASRGGSLFAQSRGRVVVASVPSIHRRLARFERDAFDLVVLDESHRARGRTFAATMDYFETAKRLLITATPERGDKFSIRDLVDSVAYDLPLYDAINEGWLVPIRRLVIESDVDFSTIRSRGGDFVASDLSAVMSRLDVLRQASVSIVENLPDRYGLVFCVDVAHAVCQTESLREVMRERGVAGRVEMVIGDTPKEERRAMFAAYRRREIAVLCGVDVFNEGTDLPPASLLAMLRPTKSQLLFNQQRGRGLRTMPGIVDGPATAALRKAAIAASSKPDLLVLDFVGNFERHVDSVVDSLDGLLDDDDPDAPEVRRILKRGDTDNLMEAIERARALRFGRDRARLAREGDFFAIFGLVRESHRWGKEMSPAQRAMLEKVGIPLVGVDQRGANQAITEIIRRRDARLCNYRQARVLVRARVPLHVIERSRFDDSSLAISRLSAANYQLTGNTWWLETLARADQHVGG
jgi:superfamily II DNA or RNA helicase